MDRQTDEIVEGESRFKQYPTIFLFSVLVAHKFIEDRIDFHVYIGICIVLYANLLYFTAKTESAKTWFAGSNSWLKINLLALSWMAAYFTLTFLISGVFVSLGSLIPESVSSIFPVILLIGFIFYLIGGGFYLIEKSIKE